ncbi:MAG: F0F1 ATP synthase subunit B [Pseudomonadota bacterium]
MLIILQDHGDGHGETDLTEELAEATSDDHSGAYNPLEDAGFWVGLAFVIVIAFAVSRGVFKQLAGMLDKRAQNIADELDKARRLREEAQELLARYQRRQQDAETEAEDIIEQAKRDAKRLEQDAREKLTEQLERRTKAAEAKIARAEEQALAEVRGKTAELAAAAAEEIIRDRMDASAQNALVDRAIGEVRGKLN